MQSNNDAALTGEAHTRFTIVATLLQCIEPVRGQATVHGLDQHPHDTTWGKDKLLKKFLESFALVWSTAAKGGETASAVCMEQDRLTGTVLRVARNGPTPPALVASVQDILNDLIAVANGDVAAKTKKTEEEMTFKVINITQKKFRSLIKTLHKEENKICVERAIDAMKSDETFQRKIQNTGFESWVKILPEVLALSPDTTIAELVPYAEWASKGRWVHSANIEELFQLTESDTPKLVQTMYKLGRYYSAVMNMLNLAKKRPELFNPIHMEILDAPPTWRFTATDDQNPLVTVLKRLSGREDVTDYLQQLGKFWLVDTPEQKFRKSCRHDMTVHAEMQMLSFYDHNPEHTPRLRFMGTSKKACFLCYEFLSRHSLAMTVSASHYKLYPSWMPAPCRSSHVRKEHKKMLWDLSKHLEATAARDLETRLGLRRRRAYTGDSSAGPSLPTTESFASAAWWADGLLAVVSAGVQGVAN